MKTAAIARAAEALGDPRAMPDVPWVSRLLHRSDDEVERVMLEVGELVDVEKEIHAAHLDAGRDFYAQFRAPFEIYALIRILKPDHVIETGVSSGVSSAHFLLALARNGRGRLHSIDLPEHQKGEVLARNESPVCLPPGRESGWAVPAAVRRDWDLRIGPAQDLLPGLVEELPSVGLFLHDDLHTPTQLSLELKTLRPKLRPGGVVLADNTKWTGLAFDRFAASLGVPVQRRSGSDLVGLTVPEVEAPGPAKQRPPTSRRRAPRSPGKRSARATRSR